MSEFTLRDALDATRGWDDDSIELDDSLLEQDDDSGDADTTYDSGWDDEDVEIGSRRAVAVTPTDALRMMRTERLPLEVDA